MNDIDILREQLSRVRSTVIQLMPERIRDILVSCSDCSSKSGFDTWRQETAEKLLDFAQCRPAHEMGQYGSLSPRAPCPLCGGGSENPIGAQGFAFPEGLLRHLLGSHHANPVLCLK